MVGRTRNGLVGRRFGRVMPQQAERRGQDDGQRGRYAARLPGIGEEAELVYNHRGEGVISADHTGVPPAAEGHGVGAALVRRMVEDARAKGWTIVPRCPFVAAQAKRHPEWAAVFTRG